MVENLNLKSYRHVTLISRAVKTWRHVTAKLIVRADPQADRIQIYLPAEFGGVYRCLLQLFFSFIFFCFVSTTRLPYISSNLYAKERDSVMRSDCVELVNCPHLLGMFIIDAIFGQNIEASCCARGLLQCWRCHEYENQLANISFTRCWNSSPSNML